MNSTPLPSLKEFLTPFGKKFHLGICSPLTDVHDLVMMTSLGIQKDRFGDLFLNLMTSFWIQSDRFNDLFFVQERWI